MGIVKRLVHPIWLSILLGMAAAVASAADVTIFTRPPAPDKLAEILLGPKYRSVGDASADAPGRFGMMINFEYDSVKIVPRTLPLLDSVGEMLLLEEVSKKVLVIEGHADASGPEAYNQSLSERRAEAIKRYLVATFDVSPKRLLVLGAGESDPHDRHDPYHAVNRRVVFRSSQSIVID